MICKNIILFLVLSGLGSVSTQENKTVEFLLLTQPYKNAIYRLDIKTKILKTLPIRDIKSPVFVSYDTEEDTVYWGEQGRLRSITIDGTNELTVRSAGYVTGIAIDVSERLLFYGDSWALEIYKMKIGTQEISTILQTTRCGSLQLDIIDKKIYWEHSLEGYDARIKSANYDGSQQKDIAPLVKNMFGLAIDIYDKILYLSNDVNNILKSNMDGSHRQLLYKGITPFINGIALYNRDTLFFSTCDSNFSNANLNTITTIGGLVSTFGPPFDSQIEQIHFVSFKDINECISSPCLNGATCIVRSKGYTCSCASGYTSTTCNTEIDECLSNPCRNGATCNDNVNGFTCTCMQGYTGNVCASGNETSEFLLLADYKTSKLYSLDIKTQTLRTLPINVTDPMYVSYDTEEERVYYGANNGLKSISIDGFDETVISERFVRGIAIDPNERLVFFVDLYGYIYKMKKRTQKVETAVTYTRENWAIELDIIDKKIYWSTDDQNLLGSCVYSANYDGSLIKEIATGLFLIYSLAIDHKNKLLYWSQLRIGIQRSNLDGSNRYLLHASANSYIWSIALYEGKTLFFTNTYPDSNRSSDVSTISTTGGPASTFGPPIFENLNGLYIVRTTEVDKCDSKPCQNGATCSDMTNGYKCSCASGYTGFDCSSDLPCPLLQLDSNTNVHYSNGTYNGSIATFFCVEGYYLREKHSLVCQGWMWSGKPPSCQNVHLPDTTSEDARQIATISGLAAAVTVVSVALFVFIILKLRLRLQRVPLCGICCSCCKKETTIDYSDYTDGRIPHITEDDEYDYVMDTNSSVEEDPETLLLSADDEEMLIPTISQQVHLNTDHGQAIALETF